jgi:hypothetical protein
MKRLLRRLRHEDERGFFVFWALGLALALLFVGVLMIDFWHIFTIRRDLNDVADSAAIVGSQQIDADYFEANGIVVLQDRSTVTLKVCAYLAVNSPNSNCSNNPNAVSFVPSADDPNRDSSVKVSLSEDVDYMAMRVLPNKDGNYSRKFTVHASATSFAKQLNP